MKASDFPDLELMREGVDYNFEISVRKFKAWVRPLTSLEVIKATAAAAQAFDTLNEHEKLSISLSLLNAMYQLNKACEIDGVPGKLTLPLMQHMSPDEINALWKQYVRVTDKVNPDFESVGAEKLKEWAEALKKSSEPLSMLTDLSTSNLIALCLHLSQNIEG